MNKSFWKVSDVTYGLKGTLLINEIVFLGDTNESFAKVNKYTGLVIELANLVILAL